MSTKKTDALAAVPPLRAGPPSAPEMTGVAPLLQGVALAPQVRSRLETVTARVRELEAAIAATALDVLLDDGAAGDRRKVLVRELHEARADQQFLFQAYKTALERDAASEADLEIAEVEASMEQYRQVAAARLQVFKDLKRISEAADEALHRMRSALFLMQEHPPRRCQMPRGFHVNPKLATVEEVEAENNYLVRYFETQVRQVAAVMRSTDREDAA